MKRKCNHILGVHEYEYSSSGYQLVEVGYNDHYTKDKLNFQAFDYCPNCGAKLKES